MATRQRPPLAAACTQRPRAVAAPLRCMGRRVGGSACTHPCTLCCSTLPAGRFWVRAALSRCITADAVPSARTLGALATGHSRGRRCGGMRRSYLPVPIPAPAVHRVSSPAGVDGAVAPFQPATRRRFVHSVTLRCTHESRWGAAVWGPFPPPLPPPPHPVPPFCRRQCSLPGPLKFVVGVRAPNCGYTRRHGA